MDLTTDYLGLELANPFMTGASPLADDLDTVKQLEDAGASAITVRSLFEEQIDQEQVATADFLDSPAYSFAEALSYLPAPTEFALGPEEYLEQIRLIRDAVDVPVVASLNGTHGGRWLDYAELIEEAGASALELNLYELVTSVDETVVDVEDSSVQMVYELKARIGIPLAVKLSPYYTALPSFAGRLESAGAEGLILFNRFYQADIDVEELDVVRSLNLSSPTTLLLRLRWLAVLSSQLRCSLAVSGGVHTGVDAVKAVMCGAHGVQMVSALLKNGPGRLAEIRTQFENWLVEHEYESLNQMRGSMNLEHSPDPAAFERANYMQILQSWRGHG
ncbi:MAG: dihydroorotate dehydrogenase-like protein [bacterium]|nr:dihydroorotate dehydrogenase-like protein [bacterium]